MPLKLKWPFKFKLLKVASDGKFGRLKDYDFYWKNGKKIPLKHQGSDYRLPCGIPFHSPVKGKVDILEKRDYGYGYFVRIKFGIYHIGFAHNSRLDIKLGQTIKVGQQLGLTGSSGRGKSCHSHVELKVHGKVVNPETMIQWTEVTDMYAEKPKKYSDGKSRSAKSWFNAFVTEYNRKTTARKQRDSALIKVNKLNTIVSQQKSKLKTLSGQIGTLQKDLKESNVFVDKMDGIVGSLEKKIEALEKDQKEFKDFKKKSDNQIDEQAGKLVAFDEKLKHCEANSGNELDTKLPEWKVIWGFVKEKIKQSKWWNKLNEKIGGGK